MEITTRALLTLIHGMLFGAFFLMSIFGLIVAMIRAGYAEHPSRLTSQGNSLERLYLVCMLAAGWIAVLAGAYLIYPRYRAIPPAGIANFSLYPRSLLLSSPNTAGWHDLGMEWKEHVAWIAPIAMTMVAYVWTKYKGSLTRQIRTAVLVFALAALGAAGVAGFFGAMLNKYAPVNGGTVIRLMGEGHE